MAEIHWLNPVSANWDKASDWSGGVVPGLSDDAFLDAAGATDYTVKVEGSEQAVNSLEISATATLDVGTAKGNVGFSIFAGLNNAGVIVVNRGSYLLSAGQNGGTISNSGTISAVKGGLLALQYTVNNMGLIEVDSGSMLNGSTNTFVGGGTIELRGGTILGGGDRHGISYMTNVDNLIEGSGVIGGVKSIGRRLVFTNDASGVVDANAKSPLTFVTGVQTVTNAGVIEATNGAVCTIRSTVSNTGTLEANGGTLMLERAVTGSGKVVVAAGTIVITTSHAAETVTFTGKSGTLELDWSQAFSGKVKGFSLTGQTTLDLRDIAFVSPNEATFSGTASSGVLTVTDGTHTARINLVGDYTGSAFVASSDGNGGVDIVDPPVDAPSATHFVGAMATLGGRDAATGLVDARAAPDSRLTILSAPRLSIA